MRIGKLRHRIALQALVAGSPQQKPTGEPDESWATFATVYGAIRPLSGRELLAAQQVASLVDHEIEIRYRAGITAKMRALFEGVIYNIEAVLDPDLRHIRLILRCTTGVNEG